MDSFPEAQDTQEKTAQKFRLFSLPEMIFITFMAVLNVGFDLLLSPILILFLGHIITGILIMVPINFIFISLTKHLVDKIGSLTIYMVVFSSIAIPTTFYGSSPGIYKLVTGVVVGFILDAVYIVKKPIFLKILLGGLLGSIGWWFGTFIIWTAFRFPFISGMSILLNSLIEIAPIIENPPIINSEFFIFILFCGSLSAVQCVLLSALTYPVAKVVKKTAIYDKFSTYKKNI